MLRRGHANNGLREALLDFIEATWDNDDPFPMWVDVNGSQKPTRWLLGQLWFCTDSLPRQTYDLMGLTGRQTYACAAREIARLMKV